MLIIIVNVLDVDKDPNLNVQQLEYYINLTVNVLITWLNSVS